MVRTWSALAALTALSTALHLSGLPAHITGALVLIVAWIKARLILLNYLELHDRPGWACGILLALAALIALLIVLFLAAGAPHPA
ncbi:cytochrome C oxidase subunit IV family protein [uncultured Roseobacter sp.]|uniref:cytochrome C oxidase subunit IV family protein n=1 Tax=uncultured Roseobacter sp. TaxID=114847 RepID=UPI00262C68B9|nr:cytochrome C oxidase subunit IV family protein [uncultured Roseobacter sp.]